LGDYRRGGARELCGYDECSKKLDRTKNQLKAQTNGIAEFYLASLARANNRTNARLSMQRKILAIMPAIWRGGAEYFIKMSCTEFRAVPCSPVLFLIVLYTIIRFAECLQTDIIQMIVSFG
jgi:hypothetical protein